MLTALNYFGGKARPGLNKWIRSILPDDRSVTYVEPYAGMLGILRNPQTHPVSYTHLTLPTIYSV